MREIKFRAWCKFENKMYNKFYIEDHMKFAFMDELIDSAKERYEIMQYIGLKDVNDVEIFEGDIVRAYHRLWEQHVTLKVHYLNGCFMFGNYNAHGFFKERLTLYE